MKHVIFYSWQSGLDPALTRNFIEEALERAVKAFATKGDVRIDAEIDRDTAGVVGTPAITDTILRKIDACDVFVCDVSITNIAENVLQEGFWSSMARAVAKVVLEHTQKVRVDERPTPNPNVLVELGYPVARIGWDRVILVQNTFYGGIEMLPFDLRGRRVVSYHLSSKEARSEKRPSLRDEMAAALRRALNDLLAPKFWVGELRPRWFGFWYTPAEPTRTNWLFIREVGASGFWFHMGLVDGARSGLISGVARFTGFDSAYATIGTGDGQSCELKFRRDISPTRQIRVEEGEGCGWFKGMGATFAGAYSSEDDLLFRSGALDELDLQRLYIIAGQHYKPLLHRFQQISTGENCDTFAARVNIGGAKGLYTIFEAVVMRGENGQLWAAYIEEDQVFFFTTEPEYKNQLPETIEKWRERFSSKKVVYVTSVEIIPKF